MIPKSFTLMNRTYDVVDMPNEFHLAGEQDGYFDKERGTISVFTGDTYSQEYIRAIFFHELAHALLEATGRENLSKDEHLVEVIGSVLHQYTQTKKGKFGGPG
jgi:Zn-dependent peptidase ImmA (M78 family)